MAKFSQSHFSLHIYGDAQAFTLSQDASNQHLPQWRRHSKDDLSQSYLLVRIQLCQRR